MKPDPIYKPRPAPVTRPVPVVQVQPEPKPQPQQQQHRPKRPARSLGWLFQFIIASALLTFVWWGTVGAFGYIMPFQGGDLIAYLAGIVFLFFAYLSGWANRWAEENCVFFKKGG